MRAHSRDPKGGKEADLSKELSHGFPKELKENERGVGSTLGGNKLRLCKVFQSC